MRAHWMIAGCLFLGTAGCPKTSDGVKPAAKRQITDILVGTWKDDSGGRHKIVALKKKEPVVTYVVDWDGEVGVVNSSGFADGAYQWNYTMPSADMSVTVTIDEATDTQLRATWKNSADATGSWTMTRFE